MIERLAVKSVVLVVVVVATIGFSMDVVAIAPTAPAPASPVALKSPASPTIPAPATVIPALTTISLEITAALSSKINRPGDVFPIRLSQPIVVQGVLIVPAGVPGFGEVIEAKRGGMSGSPGVLILAARYLIVDGRHLALRSMHIAGVGADRRGLADVVGITFGLPALFITGGATTIDTGTIAQAKTAESFQSTAVGETPAHVAPALVSATQ